MKFAPISFLNLVEGIDEIPFQGNYGNKDQSRK